MKSTSLFKIFSILVIFICAFGYIDNWFMLSFFSITTIFISAYLSKRHAFKLCLEHNVKQIDIFIPLMAGVVSLIILVVLVLSGSLSAIVYGKLIAVFFIGLGILLIYGYGILKSLEMDFKNPPDDKIYIGHEVSSFFPSAVFIPEVVRSQHQIIFGTTGSGKTVSVLYPQIEHDIRTGKVVVILDPKGDKKFSDKVFNYCLKYGRKFHYFSISNHKCSDRYNPFLFGEPSQIKDKIMSVTDWSEKGDGVYYKKLSELALQVAVEELKEDITLKKIKNLIPDDEVLIGLKTDLELLDRTPFSYLMDDTENGLFEIYQQEKVFFISLDEDSYPVISESLGKIVLSDLKSLSGYINNHINENERKPISLYIDEISTFMSDFMADYFFNFLAKTRSSNISVIMASHAPKGDFEKYGSHILDRLISLTTTHIIMRNTAPDSAEYLSKMLGTKEAEKLTSQISEGVFSLKTGLGSMRPVEEFVISPNKIRKLQRAEAYIHIAEGNVLEWVYLDHYHHDKQEGISYENYFEKMNGLNENDTRGEYGPNQEKGRTGKKGEKERERTVQGKLSLRVSEQAEG